MSKRVAIGIDLGTTNSCVGVFRDGKVDIIANDVGSRTTPSVVAFTDQERLVGNSAKEQASVNAKNTVFEAKRLIGRRFADASVQNDIKQWPFEVLDDDGAPKIRVQYRTDVKVLTPEEISAMVLAAMKKVADTYIGKEVFDAVITVPAYFDDSQRQATMDAGKIAGLNVLHILNEPTAAAIAYGFDKKIIVNQNILVFDLGGGTFDVAILSIAGNDFTVIAVGGDTHLGGGDFDSILVEHFLSMIKRKHGKDISGNQRAIGRLRSACESVKVKLSSSLKTNIDVACLFDGIDFRESITRKRFEELCSDLFKKTIEHVKSVVDDSGINQDQIQEVILVGGSSRIPKIQKLLRVFFSGKKLNSTINPDEAVAYGAAVRAALASGERTIEEITLTDVIPLSLGLTNVHGKMRTFIGRNTRIPTTVTQEWTTTADNVTLLNKKIYEGERKIATNNKVLGSFEFHLGERAKAGVPKLLYTFTVDINGILHVSGENRNTNSTAGVTIVSNKGRLTKMEVEKMVEEAKIFNNGPSVEDSGPSKDSLESYCFDKKKDAEEKFTRKLLSEAERDSVISWCEEAVEWLDDNDGLPKDAYDRKLRETKFKCAPILANVTPSPSAAAAWPGASW